MSNRRSLGLVITDPMPATADRSAPAISPRLEGEERQTLLLPRWVIYFQGALLAAIALLFFLAGVWIGGFGNTSGPGNPGGGTTATVRLDSLLQYRARTALHCPTMARWCLFCPPSRSPIGSRRQR